VRIWDALEQPRSLAELCDVVVSEFDVAPAECQTDVMQLLASLEQEGLIEIAA
jgi:hypothetical protein